MIKLLTRPATYQTLIRYALGLGMLPYGLTKIARTQFIVLPFHSWSEPLKDISGVTLTWAFLGYSPWFTVLLGFLEVIPAVLLLFRKTKLLGALLLFPMVLNVFLINVALDLWVSTQRISAVFLAMNIVLLLFHHPVLRKTFSHLLNYQLTTSRKIGRELLINGLIVSVVAGLSGYEIHQYTKERNILTGDWYYQRPNYWIARDSVQYYQGFSSANIDEQDYVRYYFQPYQRAYQLIPDSDEPIYRMYKLDEPQRTLAISNRNNSSSVTEGSYKIINENTIEWTVGTKREKLWLSRRSL